MYPELGVYTLYVRGFRNHTHSAVASRSFQITQKEQVIEVKFESDQSQLDDEELSFLQKWLDEGQRVWIELKVDFRWLAKFPILPSTHKDIFIRCRTQCRAYPHTEIQFKTCTYP